MVLGCQRAGRPPARAAVTGAAGAARSAAAARDVAPGFGAWVGASGSETRVAGRRGRRPPAGGPRDWRNPRCRRAIMARRDCAEPARRVQAVGRWHPQRRRQIIHELGGRPRPVGRLGCHRPLEHLRRRRRRPRPRRGQIGRSAVARLERHLHRRPAAPRLLAAQRLERHRAKGVHVTGGRALRLAGAARAACRARCPEPPRAG